MIDDVWAAQSDSVGNSFESSININCDAKALWLGLDINPVDLVYNKCGLQISESPAKIQTRFPK